MWLKESPSRSGAVSPRGRVSAGVALPAKEAQVRDVVRTVRLFDDVVNVSFPAADQAAAHSAL